MALDNILFNEHQSASEVLILKGKELIGNQNQLAKSIAAYLRNQIEDFHVAYLSDNEMKELNPLISNAIFSYLLDYGDDYLYIGSDKSVIQSLRYIYNNTFKYFNNKGLSDEKLEKFYMIIKEGLTITFKDLEMGAIMLAGYNILYVPSYWEDCIYNSSLRLR